MATNFGLWTQMQSTLPSFGLLWTALREVHVVKNTTCGNICGVFHHKYLWRFSPQVQITTSTCGDIVHSWVKGQGAQHKWGKHV